MHPILAILSHYSLPFLCVSNVCFTFSLLSIVNCIQVTRNDEIHADDTKYDKLYVSLIILFQTAKDSIVILWTKRS